MNLVQSICREVVGLFVDDEFLALAVLGVVGLAALLAFWLVLPTLVTGAVLLVGCIAVLVASALRARER
ncbi:conserved hypothetical protein [Bosea sp. 62]|uniref:hypothetical protein n=1 Tax=unclassified Bosea (in: a-proteobacteria) TaxID=2653178 RepID=UPI001256B064|nr:MULTISPECIES: hypothetical protein [unclassified Bosea (in: a-proteobacteria)]CAD5288245.1 conserved hypothetical protein [Bosea sp. 21B]CAD5290527.1 conserved hypothetical protein [Bosea sp. 46]CAD5300890.1 conserved hypothetical protein [Bosea sp. 7B]VVT60374.1 conserved hypothetical protein [Bosea sp. EC-HK365B]VXA97783.1 conserved hypothetical protein [Bosea sp. 62]